MRIAERLKHPTAYLPLAMSLAMLLLVLGALAFGDAKPAEDEGAAARVFQLLLVAQLPIIVVGAARSIPKDPRGGLAVLALQVVAAALAVAWVVLLER